MAFEFNWNSNAVKILYKFRKLLATLRTDKHTLDFFFLMCYSYLVLILCDLFSWKKYFSFTFKSDANSYCVSSTQKKLFYHYQPNSFFFVTSYYLAYFVNKCCRLWFHNQLIFLLSDRFQWIIFFQLSTYLVIYYILYLSLQLHQIIFLIFSLTIKF